MYLWVLWCVVRPIWNSRQRHTCVSHIALYGLLMRDLTTKKLCQVLTPIHNSHGIIMTHLNCRIRKFLWIFLFPNFHWCIFFFTFYPRSFTDFEASRKMVIFCEGFKLEIFTHFGLQNYQKKILCISGQISLGDSSLLPSSGMCIFFFLKKTTISLPTYNF